MPTPAPAQSRDFTLDILCKDAPGVLQVRWRGQDYEPTASVDAAGRITLDGSGETVASPSALLQRVMALNAATLCASGKANGWDGVCYDGRPLAEVRRA